MYINTHTHTWLCALGLVVVCRGLGATHTHIHKHTHTHTRARSLMRTLAFTYIQGCSQDICANVCASLCGRGYAGKSGCSAPSSQPACKANKVRLLLLSVDRDRDAMPVAPVLRASRWLERVWNAAPLDPCVVLPCERCLARRFLFAISLGGLWLTIVADC